MDSAAALLGSGGGSAGPKGALLPWGEWDRPDGLETISKLQCYAVFINAIIGTGVFALPFAVHSAGWGLSLAVLVVCAFFGWLTAGWTIEACARAGAILRAPPAAEPEAPGGGLGAWRPRQLSDGSLNVDGADRGPKGSAAAPGAVDYRLMLGWERTDFAALSRLFLGPCGQRALVYLTAAQCYTVLWAYTSVFSSSLASIVFEYGGLENGRCVMPLDKPTNAAHCELVYYVCVGAFATLVVPLTMLDIEEQANVQLALTAYRFLALGVMIVTLLISMAQTTDVQTRTFAPALRDDVDWTGFAVVFNAAAVAFNFQLNMPDALRPLADKDAARQVMSSSFATVVVFYIVMSLLASAEFGDSVLEPVTLNWRAFNASWRFSVPQNQSDAGAADIERPKEWWVFTLQLIVLCFPIIDQVSVYPIVGNAMANNMTAYIVPWSVEGADSADGVTHTARQRTLAKYGIRLLCAVPPIFLGAIAGNLKTIFAFAGLASFFLEFVFPALFQLYSVQKFKDHVGGRRHDRWLDGARTPYSNAFSAQAWPVLILAFGSLAVTFATLQLFSPPTCKWLWWVC